MEPSHTILVHDHDLDVLDSVKGLHLEGTDHPCREQCEMNHKDTIGTLSRPTRRAPVRNLTKMCIELRGRQACSRVYAKMQTNDLLNLA